MLSVNQERAVIALSAFGAGAIAGFFAYKMYWKWRASQESEEVEVDTYVEYDEEEVGVINPIDSMRDSEPSHQTANTESSSNDTQLSQETEKSFSGSGIANKPPLAEFKMMYDETDGGYDPYSPICGEIADQIKYTDDLYVIDTDAISYYDAKERHELSYFPVDDIYAGFDDELEELSEEELEGSIRKYTARIIKQYCEDFEYQASVEAQDLVYPYGAIFLLNQQSGIAYKVNIMEGEYIDAYVAWGEE